MSDQKKHQSAGLDQEPEHGQKQSKSSQDTPAIEWWAAGISAALILGLIVVMSWNALTTRDHVPIITLQVDTVVVVPGGYLVEFTARNAGGRTAAQLQVVGELREDSASVQTSQTTFGYVPAHSERTAGLYFTKDPSRYRLVLRPVGYEQP